MAFIDKKLVAEIATDTTVTTTSVLAGLILACKSERGNLWEAINSTCHMIDGDDRSYSGQFENRDTPLAIALIGSAMFGWAVIYQLVLRALKQKSSIISGIAMAAFAYLIDYYVVPKQFTPGFEKMLSKKAIFFAYVILALALGLRPETSVKSD